MAQLDVRVGLGLLDHHLLPQLRHVKHISLIDRAHLAVTLSGNVERHLSRRGMYVRGIEQRRFYSLSNYWFKIILDLNNR